MTAFTLKIIAIISMLIDHIGKGFFPDHPILQAIGRLAFPIFAWSIALGYRKTRNIYAYIRRLTLFALLSQVPFYLYINSVWGLEGVFSYWNVIVTLLAGLIAIYLYDKSKQPTLGFTIVLLIAIITWLVGTDFGLIGVLSIFGFHIFYNEPLKLLVSQGIFLTLPSIIMHILSNPGMPIDGITLIPLAYLVALIPIYLYNGQQGIRAKYLFYIFYPAHFLVLYGLKVII